MTMDLSQRRWLSLHFFYHHFEKIHTFLSDCLFPIVNQLQKSGQCQQWFFLRYWEGGPHIRLRLLNPNPQVEVHVRARAHDYMEKYPPKIGLTAEDYYCNHHFDGKPVDIQKLSFYANGSILKISYEPEYERYGGEQAMGISEGLFHQSSEMVAKVMQKIGNDLKKLASFAMDVMVVTSLGLGVEPDELAQFFSHYAHYWSIYVDHPQQIAPQIEQAFEKQQTYLVSRIQTLTKFISNGGDHPWFQDWIDVLNISLASYRKLGVQGELVSSYDSGEKDESMRIKLTIQSIAFSMIHMTNNRLGIAPLHEFYLGRLIELAAAVSFRKSKCGNWKF